jgi:SAM-dependent methyltransferase
LAQGAVFRTLPLSLRRHPQRAILYNMPRERFPARIIWAVERLSLTGSERILEVGCGTGRAAGLIVPALRKGGHLTAIDRSTTAIAAARKLAIADHVTFYKRSLADMPASKCAFDVIFAVNVNAFWTGGKEEIAAVAALLTRHGRLQLFYETPSDERRDEIASRTRDALTNAGLAAHVFVEGKRLAEIRARLTHRST